MEVGNYIQFKQREDTPALDNQIGRISDIQSCWGEDWLTVYVAAPLDVDGFSGGFEWITRQEHIQIISGEKFAAIHMAKLAEYWSNRSQYER